MQKADIAQAVNNVFWLAMSIATKDLSVWVGLLIIVAMVVGNVVYLFWSKTGSWPIPRFRKPAPLIVTPYTRVARPPTQNTPTRYAVLALSVFCLLVVGYQTISKDPATDFLVPNPRPNSGVPIVEAGKLLEFETFVINAGPAPATGTRWHTVFSLIGSDFYKDLTDEKAFLDSRADALEKLALDSVVADMSVGVRGHKTVTLQQYDQAQVESIQRDEMRIYANTWIIWSDANGMFEKETCVYLRPPATDPVWRACNSHNETRRRWW